ncbi:MAG: DUF3006 domain-containing protein [Chloroflexi bacterium]|nr:DUF3006 domain-containing protein [Chloroflexota bacterium]
MARLRLVIDRIEDGRLAVLFDDQGRQRMNVPVESLPPGSTEGDWLVVTPTESGALVIEMDRGETEARRKRIRAKLDRLRASSRNGDEQV